MGLNGPHFTPDADSQVATKSFASSGSAVDLFHIDLAQGIAIGGCFYLVALRIVESMTPSSMVLMMTMSGLWCLISAWKLMWREAALAFGLTIGVSANLFTPVLLFLLFLVAWGRAERATSLPWIALGLGAFAVVAGMVEPTMLGELHQPKIETLYNYYLVPVTFGAMSCASMSHFAVALARSRAIDASLQLLSAQWLSVGALLLTVVAMGQTIIRFSRF